MKTRLLMCPPRHFEVSYDINPWMSRNVGYSAPEAARQWERLVETLQVAADVSIELVDPRPGVPDLVFTANAALMSGKLAILSSFRHPERRREQPLYRAWLASRGYATTFLQQTFFEGAGDALFDRRRPILYAGYGWRSERGAALQLGETLDLHVIPLLLVDERFYHLDTCFCPLADGKLLFYPAAFTSESLAKIHTLVAPQDRIEASQDEADAFCVNAVCIGYHLIMARAPSSLRVRLGRLGYRLTEIDLAPFILSGGGAYCMTLRLDRRSEGPATMRAAE